MLVFMLVSRALCLIQNFVLCCNHSLVSFVSKESKQVSMVSVWYCVDSLEYGIPAALREINLQFTALCTA